jgi:hypothetical protein
LEKFEQKYAKDPNFMLKTTTNWLFLFYT